jgi:hypothetical protein
MFCHLHEAILEHSDNSYFLLSWNKRRAALDRTAVASSRSNIARFFAASVNNYSIGELSHVVVSILPTLNGACNVAIGILEADTLAEDFFFEVDHMDFSMFQLITDPFRLNK